MSKPFTDESRIEEQIMQLKDVLPHEFMNGEYDDAPAYKLRNIVVVQKHDGRNTPWPGKHKNVMTWWELANGKSVGWNENPGRGWSFPVK